MPSTPTEAVGGAGLAAWQLPLAQVCDSAAPTGAFAHSFGMETYVDEQAITDAAGFQEWLEAMVTTQFACSDGLAIRMVHRALSGAAPDLEQVWRVDHLLRAQALPRQVRTANHTMGLRTLSIARAAAPGVWLDAYRAELDADRCHGHPAVVVGILGAALGAPVEVLVAAHLQALVITLTQNAVRLIPLGQDAGQRVIADLQPTLARAVSSVMTMPRERFGAVTLGLEMAQMRHERVRARMYMS